MDWQRIIELVIAGGAAGIITALTVLWKTQRDAQRDDRKQKSEETSGAAVAAKNITDAAGTLAKLADDQIDEFRKQIRALQAESAAMSTRMDIEIQNRMRAEARETVLKDRLNELDDRLARMGAQFELADQERQSLRRENGAMKTKLFEWSVGIASLIRQVHEAGLEPVYTIEVPISGTGRLGQIDVDAVRRLNE